MEDWNGIAKLVGFTDETAMLRSFYLDEELPISEIAKKLGVGPATVSFRLDKCKVPKRMRGGANNSHRISKKLLRMDQRLIFQLTDLQLSNMVDSHISTVYKYRRSITGGKKWSSA